MGLQRDLHTAQGRCAHGRLFAIGELGHSMESLLEAVSEQRFDLARDDVPLLERGFDRLHAMVMRVGEGRAISPSQGLIDAFDARARGEELSADGGVSAGSRMPAPAVALPPLTAPMGDVALSGDDDDITIRAPQEQVRIRADLLDRLSTTLRSRDLPRAPGAAAWRVPRRDGRDGADEHASARPARPPDDSRPKPDHRRYQREHETADATSTRSSSTASRPCSSSRGRWRSPRPTVEPAGHARRPDAP